VPRLLIVTPSELTRDPRARREAVAAQSLGFGVIGLSGRISGEEPVPLPGVVVVRAGRQGATNMQWTTGAEQRREPGLLRELRGLYRLGRLAARTATLVRAGRTIGSVEVVHANDLDTLPAAYLLAREASSRLVYDAHELYTDFEPNPPRLARRLLAALERTLARRADAVLTVSEPLAGELRRRLGVDVAIVLNAPELDDAPAPEPSAPPPLRAVYQGAFGTGRPLDDLGAAIRLAPSVRLTLRVNRSTREVLRRQLPADVADRIQVEEPVAPDGVILALRGHHVGVLFDRPLTRNAELSSPNKLFEYLMAGLAVVAPRLPGLRWLEAEQLGVLFEPGSVEAFADVLEQLAGDSDRLAELRRNARNAATKRYNAETQRDALREAWGVRVGSTRA
jgi:glycosyltransferase involved in cell wall biosynthesis